MASATPGPVGSAASLSSASASSPTDSSVSALSTGPSSSIAPLAAAIPPPHQPTVQLPAATVSEVPSIQLQPAPAPAPSAPLSRMTVATDPHETRAERMWRAFKQRSRRGKRGSTAAREWVSIWLHPIVLLLLNLTTSAIIAIIASLTAISHLRQGIADVGSNSNGRLIAGFQVGTGLYWTFIPVLLLQLYALWLGATVSTFAERQPYIELGRTQSAGATASKSILLDYRSYPAIFKPSEALRRGHKLLSIAFTFNLLTTVLITPIASHLFIVDDNVKYETAATVSQQTSFNDSGFDASTDILPVINLVSGVQVYGASFPAWTDSMNSYEPFDEPSSFPRSTAPSNFTATTNAYSVELGCEEVKQPNYTLTATQGSWTFNGTDRGCPLNNFIFPGYFLQRYLLTWSKNDCPYQFNDSDGRVIFFAAHDPLGGVDIPTNITVVSCTTSYFQSSGRLELSYDSTQRPYPSIRNFSSELSKSIYPRPLFWGVFERALARASTNDDTGTTQATVLGLLILNYAVQISPRNYWNSDVLVKAMRTVIESAYAVMATTHLHTPTASAVSIEGEITSVSIRLRIVNAVAYTIMCGLSLTLLVLIGIFLYTLDHESILYEEPIGLLGAATLLCNSSDAERTAMNLRQSAQKGNWIQQYTQGRDYRDAVWQAEDWNVPRDMRIVKR